MMMRNSVIKIFTLAFILPSVIQAKTRSDEENAKHYLSKADKLN
jgi:hypothetical protein